MISPDFKSHIKMCFHACNNVVKYCLGNKAPPFQQCHLQCQHLFEDDVYIQLLFQDSQDNFSDQITLLVRVHSCQRAE